MLLDHTAVGLPAQRARAFPNALEQRLQTLLLLLAGTGATHKLEGSEGQKPSEKDPDACLHGPTPNGEHQRRERAAAEQRIQAELNGWLPAAECCGSGRLAPGASPSLAE